MSDKPATTPRLKPRAAAEVRARIRTVLLIDKLQAFALGEKTEVVCGEPVRMSKEQLRAAEILLKKALPDLSSVEMTGEGGGGLIVNIRQLTPPPTDGA